MERGNGVPILPIIDLLIFAAWTSLSIGGVLKAIYITTQYRPTFLTFSPVDLLIIACVLLLLALSLAARSWVKSFETKGQEAGRGVASRAQATLDAYESTRAQMSHEDEGEMRAPEPAAAAAGQR